MGRNQSASWTLWDKAGWCVALALASFVLVDKAGLLQLVQHYGEGLAAALSDMLPTSADPDISFQNDHQNVDGRRLGGGSAGTTHPQEAMYFLVLTIVMGTFILQLSDMKLCHGLQQSVAVCCVGCVTAILAKVFHLDETVGGVGRSLLMWSKMDPHLLLWTLLPPLLAGDAMTIDTFVARKVWKQCVFLAGPGVLINAFASAGFLKLILPSWPFLLCLTTGSILCATDPVAVVGLLKELGASPTLTVQIQGESLLNDGTAIVLFYVAWDLLIGKEYATSDIIVFLVKKVLYALIFGAFLGFFFLGWINSAKHRFHHNSSIIQVSLTVACAYFSFCFAEGILETSGVLSTVAASLVLADKMWTEVIEKEAMHTIWHMFEYLGNTIIFTLAGVLTGYSMIKMKAEDYARLLAIYVALTLLRFGLLFASLPLLRWLHPDRRPVEVPDAIVMGWGGLRGAVGLAMGVQVILNSKEQNLSKIHAGVQDSDPDRVLFFVGGVALMTMVINATTCPALVTYLGITQRAECKKKIMLLIKDRLMEIAQIEICTPAVKRAITGVLDDIANHIDPGSIKGGAVDPLARRGSSLIHAILSVRMTIETNNESLAAEFEAERDRFLSCSDEKRQQLHRVLPETVLFDDADVYLERIRMNSTDPDMARAFAEIYHKALKAEYWKMIDDGRVRHELSYVLLTSVINPLSTPSMDVSDFAYILKRLGLNSDDGEAVSLHETFADDTAFRSDAAGATLAQKASRSVWFHVFLGVTILVNSALVYMFEYLRTSGHFKSHDPLVWVVLELLFMCVYVAEFVVKLAALRQDYWRAYWNRFEFMLMLLGILTLSVWWAQIRENSNDDTWLGTFVKVLTVMRIVRFVRFFRIIQFLRIRAKGQMVAADNADHLLRFDALTSFIKAHANTTKELVMFFQRQDDINLEKLSVEFARSIIQSELAVYRAMLLCIQQLPLLDPWVLEEIEICQQNIDASTELEEIIDHAGSRGILAPSEADDLKHMFHSHITRFTNKLRDVRGGRVDQPEYAQEGEDIEPMESGRHPSARSFGHSVSHETQRKEMEDRLEEQRTRFHQDLLDGNRKVNFVERFSLQDSTHTKCTSKSEPWGTDDQLESTARRRSIQGSRFPPKALESQATNGYNCLPQEEKATDDDGGVRLPMPKTKPSKNAVSRPPAESQCMEGKSGILSQTRQMSKDSLNSTRQKGNPTKGQKTLPLPPPAPNGSGPPDPQQPTTVPTSQVEAEKKKKKEKKKTATATPSHQEFAAEDATEQKQNSCRQ